MCKLYTIGYEGHTIDSFVDILRDEQIRIVIDVRQLPLSRKQGFSKKTLQKHLLEHDIRYMHEPELGSPKALRDKLHRDGNYEYFFENYLQYAIKEETALNLVIDVAEATGACLLCYEKDPTKCHRSVLAKILCAFSNTIDVVVDIH